MTPERARAAAVVLLLAATAACSRKAGGGSGQDALAESRALVEAGRYDEALARLGDANDPDAAYLAGRAWAGKAQEERALGFYERAIAARPQFADAHLAIAELLAPRAAAAASSAAARPAARGKSGPAVAAPPDPLVSRVLGSYAAALQSDLGSTRAGEELIDFAIRVGRPAEADGAFQELVRRRREDPALLVRYGDFLAGPGGKPEAALAQYAQALIWKPDDTQTKLKMADIHLAAAAQHLRDLEYVSAEARLKEARRYATDPRSPQAARLAELEGRLRDVRGR